MFNILRNTCKKGALPTNISLDSLSKPEQGYSLEQHQRRHRRQSWGLGGSRPPDFGQGGCRGSGGGAVGGSWAGGEILYLIMYIVQEICSKVVVFEGR